MSMSGPETEEHRLRRLLYTGVGSSFVSLKGGEAKDGADNGIRKAVTGGVKVSVLESVVSLVQPAIGNTNLALQHCKAAINQGMADKRALFLVLSACLKIDSKQTKTDTYEVIKDLIQSSEDFFEFIYYHKKVFKGKPRGMGRGMKGVISNWYLSMDPYELVLEIFRAHSRHGWDHKDLIQLARVHSQDPAMSAVLSYVMSGYEKTVKKFKHEDSAQKILDYLGCVRELNQCKDPLRAIILIDQYNLDVESVPSDLLRDPAVWERTLIRTPLRVVLSYLRQMTRQGLLHLGSDQSPALRSVLFSLRDPLALASSKLQPAEILGILNQVEAGFRGPNNQKKGVPKYYPSQELVQELTRTLHSSFSNVTEMPGSVHVAVDTLQCARHKCWGAWNLSCLRAVSVTILSLIHSKMDVTVSYFTNEGVVAFIEVSTSDSVASLVEKFKEVSKFGGRVRPEAVLRSDREAGRAKDLVLCVTASDIVQQEAKEEVWAELLQARVNEEKVKFLYWALSSKHLENPVKNPNFSNMLDLYGWSPDSTRIIQAFARDFF